MPTYEYECKKCRERFERFQKMTDPAVEECPECGGDVRKVLHPPAIAFKGSGFYVNDYKKSSRPSGEDGGKATDEAAPAKKESKTETPAAKKVEPAAA